MVQPHSIRYVTTCIECRRTMDVKKYYNGRVLMTKCDQCISKETKMEKAYRECQEIKIENRLVITDKIDLKKPRRQVCPSTLSPVAQTKTSVFMSWVDYVESAESTEKLN